MFDIDKINAAVAKVTTPAKGIVSVLAPPSPEAAALLSKIDFLSKTDLFKVAYASASGAPTSGPERYQFFFTATCTGFLAGLEYQGQGDTQAAAAPISSSRLAQYFNLGEFDNPSPELIAAWNSLTGSELGSAANGAAKATMATGGCAIPIYHFLVMALIAGIRYQRAESETAELYKMMNGEPGAIIGTEPREGQG